MIGKIPGGRALLRAMYRTEHPSLEREVFGLRFPNPIGLAAGFDRNGEAFRELSALGFGFVEIGTVTPQPQAGNPRPRIFRLPADRAIINRSGLNNKGLYKAIAQLRHRHDRLIIGGNIGKNTLTQPSQVAADYLKNVPQPLPIRRLFFDQRLLRQLCGRQRIAQQSPPDEYSAAALRFFAAARTSTGRSC